MLLLAFGVVLIILFMMKRPDPDLDNRPLSTPAHIAPADQIENTRRSTSEEPLPEGQVFNEEEPAVIP